MTAARAAFLLPLISLLGCAGGVTTTSALIEVRYDHAPPAPNRIDVQVFDRFGQIGSRQIQPAPLPGKLLLAGLADVTQTIRVVVSGDVPAGPVMGTARFDTRAHAQVTVVIQLSSSFADADGDGVPDEVDDCPSASDPFQTSVLGDGVGDACRFDAAVAPDLAQALAMNDLAGSDSSAVDAAGEDLFVAPPDLLPPASKCPVAGALLCDGFDNAAFDGVWSLVQMNGTAMTDSAHVYRGARSLHLHDNAFAAAGDADVELFETATMTATHFWVRAFVYVEAAFAVEADILGVEQNASPYHGVVLALENGSFATHDTIDNTNKQAATAMPANRWVCLEWEVQLGAVGYTKLFVDGAGTSAISGNENLGPTPAIGQLSLGLVTTATGAMGARDVWIDEVVINTQSTGCAN